MRVILFVIALMSLGAIAQTNSDDWVDDDDWGDIEQIEIVTKKTAITPSFSTYWDEHFYGSISGLFSAGLQHQRQASEIKLGYNERWDNIKIVIEMANRQNNIITKYEERNDREIISEGTVTLRNQTFEFRQTYVDISPLKNVTITAGKQTIVWGQLDVFSPIDFLLPLDFNPMGFSLVKTDNRMPQTTIGLSYYPMPNVELSGFYFPLFEESPLFKNIAQGNDMVKKIMPSGSKQSSSGIRATWYANKFTTALTYYQGFNNVFPVFKEKHLISSPSEDDDDTQSEYGYYPKKGLGLEFNIPLGQLGIKSEVAISDTFTNIDINYGDTNKDKIKQLLQDYNNGYNAIPIYEAFFAIGIDADFDHWFYNFYLLSIIPFKNPKMSTFWNKYDALSKPHQLQPTPLFPTLNIGRYFNKEKKGAYGLALGFLTGSLGGFLYISNQINESWSWGASIDAGLSWSDISMLINNNNNEDDNDNNTWTEYKFVEPKLTFGLGYKL